MSVQELEIALTSLPPSDSDAFGRWLEEYIADAWDRRIEADVVAGQLDGAGREADAPMEAGCCTPL